MSQENKKISIVVLTYNNLEKLKVFCQSVLESELLLLPDILELIIFDNNSEKSVKDFLDNFKNNNSKIKISYASENFGCAGGRKRAMNLVSGEYILILDSDVLILNTFFIPKLFAALDRPDVGIVGCEGGKINRDYFEMSLVPENYEGIVDGVVGYCQFFRKSILETCELDEYYNPNGEEDWDFCLQIKQKTNLFSYKVNQANFGLEHHHSFTNRDNLKKRNINFKYMFNKFNLYEVSFFGYLKFLIKSSNFFKVSDRLIGRVFKMIKK